MERALGVMCGAGALPALMADRARRDGWRVVAFAFPGADDMRGHAERVIPGRINEIGAILTALHDEGVSAAVLAGRFLVTEVLRAEAADDVSRGVEARAGFRVDAKLFDAVAATFASVGVEMLDQRTFLSDLVAGAGCWSTKRPSDAEWRQVRHGLELARMLADARIGQTVVLRHGAVTAVEAAEGTTEAVRRGTSLGGPGAVIVKAVAHDHDYRFDVPGVGLETVAAAAAGRASVIAVEAERVMILDQEATVRAADAAGIALVSVSVDDER